jgi:hypothetical protein
MSFNSTGRARHSTALGEHDIQQHWASMSFDAANDGGNGAAAKK